MASSVSTMFVPHQSSPLARTTSPFKDPRPPPCTPAKTAKLWDEYERRAVEKARKRDRTTQAPSPQRSSASDIGKGRKSNDGSTTRSSFDFKFRRAHAAIPSMTICKTCQTPITYTSGVCDRCTRTIVVPSLAGETTPPLSPAARNFASTDLHQLHKNSSVEEISVPQSTSPKRRSFCPMPTQMMDPPVRLSSLKPPPNQDPALEPARSRKVSLTDPNEPFLRLQITHQSWAPRSQTNTQPTTPTYTTPPSVTQSRSSTRPSSLANIVSLPTSAYPYARNNSATPSEFSNFYPYASTITTSPPSLCRVNYALKNTTSAWDDWDSDDDAEKVRLMGWMGKRKVRPRGSGGKERKGSMDSLDSEQDDGKMSPKASPKEKRNNKKCKEDERLERVRIETAENARASRVASEGKSAKKKRPSVWMICGCSD